jgi:hypothetical protein
MLNWIKPCETVLEQLKYLADYPRAIHFYFKALFRPSSISELQKIVFTIGTIYKLFLVAAKLISDTKSMIRDALASQRHVHNYN